MAHADAIGTVEEWKMQKVVREEWMRASLAAALASLVLAIGLTAGIGAHEEEDVRNHVESGRHLFERETFEGNGRTCLTCHSRRTGTVSPDDARERFAHDPNDPLFRADGSDDGNGNGVQRMLADATVLVRVPLADNVSLADDPAARSVVVRRGIPTTLNAPSLDPVLMLDGRQPSLEAQAKGAIADHASGTRTPTAKELEFIAVFERTRQFFSSRDLFTFAWTGHPPKLPDGRTAAERRGRLFFEDVPFASPDQKAGACAACHSGPMLNETNQFLPVPPMRRGGRFQSVLVSELNEAGNVVHDFVFRNADGTTSHVVSPDAGRALITGKATGFEDANAFKIPTLWGVTETAPYFHDNSAKTLEDVVKHYAKFFAIVSTPPGGGPPALVLSEQDQADLVAYLKLLR
jgi:cytochrome c peroxidase